MALEPVGSAEEVTSSNCVSLRSYSHLLQMLKSLDRVAIGFSFAFEANILLLSSLFSTLLLQSKEYSFK